MSSPSAENQTPAYALTGIKSYVRRAGRFTEAQKRSYEALSGRFIVPFDSSPLNYQALFGNSSGVIAEIGFGMGIATAAIAEANTDKNYLGIEVHRPGVGKLLWEIEQRSLGNIRIIEHDAVEVFARMIPPASLEGVHLFFPDPWPKKRHHKRRLVTRPFYPSPCPEPEKRRVPVHGYRLGRLRALGAGRIKRRRGHCKRLSRFCPAPKLAAKNQIRAQGAGTESPGQGDFFYRRKFTGGKRRVTIGQR